MKKIVTFIFCLLNVVANCFAQAGSLDNTFGVGGIVTTDFGSNDAGRSVALQSDGKLVVAGNSYMVSGDKIGALARYNTDGTLDNTFDSDGKVTTVVGDLSTEFISVAIQNDGKIVTVGGTINTDSSLYYYRSMDLAVVRYKSDGSLDTTFSNDGKIVIVIDHTCTLSSVVIQADGKILAVGYKNWDVVIVRFNSNGTLDNSFDTDGIAIRSLGWYALYPNSVRVQSDNKILVAGNHGSGLGSNLFLARYNPDGSPDLTFNSVGYIITSTTITNYGYSVCQQSNGKIIVAGCIYNGNYIQFSVIRYNTNGSVDSTFGSGGIITTSFTGYDAVGYSAVIQSDDKIIVAGETFTTVSYVEFALARYTSNGTLDNSFGTGGKVITNISNGAEMGYSVLLQNDNKIAVAGFTDNNSTDWDFAIARFNNNSVTEIEESNNVGPVNIFPNPSSGKFTLQNVKLYTTDVKIYNCIGETISFKMHGDVIDLNSQSKGIYFMEIIVEGKRNVVKIILE